MKKRYLALMMGLLVLPLLVVGLQQWAQAQDEGGPSADPLADQVGDNENLDGLYLLGDAQEFPDDEPTGDHGVSGDDDGCEGPYCD